MTPNQLRTRTAYRDWIVDIRRRTTKSQEMSRDKYDEARSMVELAHWCKTDDARRNYLLGCAAFCQREAAAEADFARRFMYHYEVNTR